LLDKVRIHLAWRFDKGVDFCPDELGSPGLFCDIGCGNGSNLRKFKEAGFQVVGVEPDQDARDVASKESLVYEGTGESLPASLPDQQGYVLLSHVLEHTISPVSVLKNIHGLLKQNGVLIVEVPNNGALGFTTFKELWPWTDVPRHIHYFTEHSLRKLLEDEGFKVSQIRFVGYTRQFRSEWIADQYRIWEQVGDKTKKQPNFKLLAWRLLAQTFWASKNRKYDSIRIHAVKVGD
jgi:SAM-dependent methyltransferase